MLKESDEEKEIDKLKKKDIVESEYYFEADEGNGEDEFMEE